MNYVLIFILADALEFTYHFLRTGLWWNAKFLKDPNMYSNFILFFVFMIVSSPWANSLRILHLSCSKTPFIKLYPSWYSLASGNICPLVLALPFSLAWIYRVRNPCSSIQSSFSNITNSLKFVHFSPSLMKIISNCHEMWMCNPTCKLQWGLNHDFGRWEGLVLFIICPPRNSHTFSFLACLLLILILMVHVIIIAWSLWLFSIFIAARCHELEIYSTPYRTVAKRALTYILVHFPCSSDGAKPAHVTVFPQLYLYQRRGFKSRYIFHFLVQY